MKFAYKALKALNDTARKLYANLQPIPGEEENLNRVGHREFVGGHWDQIGELQFGFLIRQGLKPGHVFLDIACGSLRGRQALHFVSGARELPRNRQTIGTH